MMEEMNRCGWYEKSVEECDQNEVDGMKQNVDFKYTIMHIE